MNSEQVLEICTWKVNTMSSQIDRLRVPRLAAAQKVAQAKIVKARELLKSDPTKAMKTATNAWRVLSKGCSMDEIFASAAE